jgi:hypothetical protein
MSGLIDIKPEHIIVGKTRNSIKLGPRINREHKIFLVKNPTLKGYGITHRAEGKTLVKIQAQGLVRCLLG